MGNICKRLMIISIGVLVTLDGKYSTTYLESSTHKSPSILFADLIAPMESSEGPTDEIPDNEDLESEEENDSKSRKLFEFVSKLSFSFLDTQSRPYKTTPTSPYCQINTPPPEALNTWA